MLPRHQTAASSLLRGPRFGRYETTLSLKGIKLAPTLNSADARPENQ